MRNEYDTPWKEMLEEYFKDFMKFFFPIAARNIDWSKNYTVLDKELSQIVQDAKLGTRFADKLIKVYREGGKEEWILIHIEIQGQYEPNFAERLYIYNYRIFDKYKKRPVTLAVFADENRNWRPDEYKDQLWGYKINVKFPSVKLLDYTDKWNKLKSSKNIFAIVVMAHLKTKETKKNYKSRKVWKTTLVKMLYEKNYKKQDIINLFRFIDWIMQLPKELEQVFIKEISKHEEDKKMPYITSVERYGMEKGMQQGILQGMQQGILQGMQRGMEQGILQGMERGMEQGILQGMQQGKQEGRQEGRQQGIASGIMESTIDILQLRFGEVPFSISQKINEINDISELKKLNKSAVTEPSIESFAVLLN